MFVLPSLGMINYDEALEGGLSYDVVRSIDSARRTSGKHAYQFLLVYWHS